MTYPPPDWHADGYRPQSLDDDALDTEALGTSDTPRPTEPGAVRATGSRRAVIGAIAVILLVIVAVGYWARTAWVEGQTADEGPLNAELEAAAVAVVQLYNDAWQQADCEKFVASTTPHMRLRFNAPDCDEFSEQTVERGFPRENFAITVRSVEKVGEEITVMVGQSWSAQTADDVNEIAYTLVRKDGAWRVDDD